MQADDPCDGTCDDMDEDIASQEDAFEHMAEDDNTNTVDSNIIVIDEEAQSDYFTENSEKPEATDTIYIDDTAEDISKPTPDIDIGPMRFDK